MRLKTIPPGTTIDSPLAQLTTGGSNTELGTIICHVMSPPHEETFVTDSFDMVARYPLLPAFAPTGVYVFPLNVHSRQTNWRIQTPLGVAVTLTAS